MSTNETNQTVNEPTASKGHSGVIATVAVGLAIALAGDGYLLVRSNHLKDQMAEMQTGTDSRISKLGTATTALLEQRLESLNDAIDAELKSTKDSASSAVKFARTEAQKQGAQLSGKLDEQQKQVSAELTQLKDETTTASTKLTEVFGDVNNVKTDVTGVKSDVSGIKTDIAATQSEVEKTSLDLKRAMGDMGVMSGLIATNSKDLQVLRDLGDRNYMEFRLAKGQMTRKVGDVTLTLKKADPKHNRYTVAVNADDKLIEKKDKTINEPVQLYVSGNRQPYEIVVNQVKKDEVVGYLSTPKIKMARR